MLNNEESRKGAMACRDTLLAIKNTAENNGGGWEEWWRNEDDAIAATIHSAGDPNGFVAGFMAVLAEYIRADLIGCGYNLDTWKPQAAMTEEEKAADRARYEDAVAAQ